MIILNGVDLTLEQLIRITRNYEKVSICKDNIEKVNEAHLFVRDIVENEKKVYGITTGFGKLSDVVINKKDTALLQRNLLISHACGVGDILEEDIVRGMMVLRVNALIKGFSGIRIEVINKLVEMLNKRVYPVVYEKGSLGASGDLAPLAHMSLPLIGLGEVIYNNIVYKTKDAFNLIGIDYLDSLYAKEGLSLINGTQFMTSIGAHTLFDAYKLFRISNLSLSMTLEALEGIKDAFDPLINMLRTHTGQSVVSQDVLSNVEGSLLVSNQGVKRVQDAYSLRCSMQVHGASFDSLEFVREKIEIEMNSVTDNPLIFVKDNKVISAGNFHGEPIAQSFDLMSIALSELANIAERRLERLVNPALSNGLPPFLVNNAGLNSGFMIVQYTAAALVSENKVLSHPASVDSIPSSGNQEDHVSMGSIGVVKARKVLENTRKVIGLELFTACQGYDFKEEKQLGVNTKKLYEVIRKYIPFINDDDLMYYHMHEIEKMIIDDRIYNYVFGGNDE